MEEIKNDFADFIKELVSSYPKIQPGPSNLSLIGKQSREYNEKVKDKVDELISQNPKLEALAISPNDTTGAIRIQQRRKTHENRQ
ncbi:MAG: hypothetical protein ACTHMI_15100 [Mucilaginibacter sp.]